VLKKFHLLEFHFHFDKAYPTIDTSTKFIPLFVLRRSLPCCRLFDSAQSDSSRAQYDSGGAQSDRSRAQDDSGRAQWVNYINRIQSLQI